MEDEDGKEILKIQVRKLLKNCFTKNSLVAAFFFVNSFVRIYYSHAP